MTASTIRRSRPTTTQGPSSRARFITDADGRFFFRTILPCSYPIPTDGPVGEMIMQTRRHPMRPAHVHFLVDAPGYEPLITHVFIEGDKYLDSDVVFGVKDELIAKIEKRTDPMMPDGKPAAAPWHLMTYEFRMKPGEGTAPKPMMARRPRTPENQPACAPAHFLCGAQEMSESQILDARLGMRPDLRHDRVTTYKLLYFLRCGSLARSLNSLC